MDHYSLEDLARLNEADAIRRRLDRRNLRLLPLALGFFFLAALIEVMVAVEESAGGAGGAVTVAAGNAAALALAALILRRARGGLGARWLPWLDPLARRVDRNVPRIVVGFLVGQYLLVVVYVALLGGTQVWPFLFPFVAVLFRLVPGELTAVHGSFLLAGAVEPVLRGQLDFYVGVLVAIVSINAVAALAGRLLVRRAIGEVRGDWSRALDAHRDQLRMRQELEVARDLQLSMLPRESPQLSWLEIASLSLPATEVGGDYYDYFLLSDDHLVVVAGDVAGHGLASGLVLSGLRSCLTLLRDELHQSLGVMEKLHRMIRETSRRRMMATLAIASLDRRRGELVVTSAGHPPILIWRAHEERVEEVDFSTLPLGAGLIEAFEERRVPLRRGDVLLLYTDGLYETVDGAGEPYGLERLLAVVEEGAGLRSANEVRDAVLRDLWDFKGDAPQEDDITLVVLRVVGPVG